MKLFVIAGAVAAGTALTLAGCASAAPTATSASSAPAFEQAKQDPAATVTVWTDATRLPAVQKYQKSHPDAKLNIVTYDGSADGSTYLQTKVQLFDVRETAGPTSSSPPRPM